MMLSEHSCAGLDPAPRPSLNYTCFLDVMVDGQVKYCLYFPSPILKLILIDALVNFDLY